MNRFGLPTTLMIGGNGPKSSNSTRRHSYMLRKSKQKALRDSTGALQMSMGHWRTSKRSLSNQRKGGAIMQAETHSFPASIMVNSAPVDMHTQQFGTYSSSASPWTKLGRSPNSQRIQPPLWWTELCSSYLKVPLCPALLLS